MIKLFFLFIFATTSSYALQITQDSSFQNIYKDTQNNDKLVLMFYSAKTCPQCTYMKQKVFKSGEVKKFMDNNFIILEKDINKDDLPTGFEYFGIPTMFFINKEGKQIAKIVGSSRTKPFLEKLENIIKGN
jgi:thioredoxin-related protein